MSTGFVADSSVALAWAVRSQSSADTEHLLDEVAEGREFFVPVLWTFEVANGLLMLNRRKRLSPEQSLRARNALRALNPVIDEDGPRRALIEIADLAERHTLSIYDATYLELAIRKRLPLASRDTNLNRAAARSGVSTLI